MPTAYDSIMISDWPTYSAPDEFEKDEDTFEKIMNLIKTVRVLRAEKNVPPSKLLDLTIETANTEVFEHGISFIKRLAKADNVVVTDHADVQDAVQGVTDVARVLIPYSEMVDKDKEIEKLNKELAAIEKDKKGLEGRLNNPQFLSKAPENVVNGEKEKLAKLEARKALILESLSKLK